LKAKDSIDPVCIIHNSSQPIFIENYKTGMSHLTTARPDLCSTKIIHTAKGAKIWPEERPGHYYE
jgi:hypothetical protein